MRSPGRVRAAAGLSIALGATLALVPAAAGFHRACHAASPVSERVLLRPKPTTSFSRDALNPDVVRYRGRYMMFFSGNSASNDTGDWRTGVAVAKHPLGPFRVDSEMRRGFFNGGTTKRGGRLLQAASLPGDFLGHDRTPRLWSSTDGTRWRFASRIPAPAGPSWRYLTSDLFLRDGRRALHAYFAGRPGPGGADLGTARLQGGRWMGFRRILTRRPGAWDGLDLGEPAVFRAGGRTYMLYVGLAETGEPRQIGLARRTRKGWRRCGNRPFISAGKKWYSLNAIDPAAIVAGDRLYVYFAGGDRASLGADMNGTIGVRIYRLPRR